MSNRSKHLFQFTANVIATAAIGEAEYHEGRWAWWNAEYERAVEGAKTASVTVREYDVTGGKRADVQVDFAEAKRLNEAAEKREEHRKLGEAFRIEAATYETQGTRVYELDVEDVLHFRLGGGKRVT